jgi:predicted GNAT family N-acyltransferase
LRVAEVRKSLKGKLQITYIIEHENIICGAVTYLVFNHFAYIGGVLVSISHRRKKIGSYMIQYCIDIIDTPIYLQCSHEFKTFYERLGFFHVRLFQAPSELSKLRSPNLYLMVANDRNPTNTPTS